tara:strand:+ start:298 stop:933 length:636 start_codon:yes stop_codon:yes gene_type:complete
MKKYIVLAVLTFSIFFSYKYWKTTPQYSVQQVVESIESNDTYLFEKHFDIKKVSDKMSDEFVAYMTKENIDSSGDDEWGLIGKKFATGLFELMKPVLSNQISKEIIALVDNKENNNSLISDSLSFGLFDNSDLNLINHDKISISLALLFEAENINFQREGSTTTLKILLNQSNENEVIEVILKKYEDFWKITEIKNLITFILENQESVIKQ